MKNIQSYKDKQVLVLGLAKSGYAAAKLLQQLGANVVVNDIKPLEENESAQSLQSIGIRVICGEHPPELVHSSLAAIIKNPGIPYSNPLIQKAVELNIPVLTEIELAYQISEAPFIGITGSNGKTTTTTLIYEMLLTGRKNPIIAGNIGTVACEVVQTASPSDYVVTELSSFQLLGVQTFRPKISVFLNLFEAHLDYHGTKKEYGKAKSNIFMNQTEDDYLVLNADDLEVQTLATTCKARKILFSSKQAIPSGASVIDGFISYCEEKVMKVEEIALPGQHNLENILAAVSVAKLIGIENDAISHVLKTFTGVKHRLQFVTSIQDRLFYNDSKATNILATSKALSSFTQPTILLAGGLDRGNEFDDLKPYLKHVKALVTFGETAEKLIRIAKEVGIKSIEHVDNVEHAVPVAYKLSQPNDVVLLSPACASWDQYKTFEVRGDIFVEAVHRLK
ncbi:UDP-N-acetylmuramoylalanine--D-glutamate ligase [Bacillus mesophilus]|uniref:UDP-N-acetylmuramoylalanine--D-glutamate ligase n=1 Tax=Bacillus mesophilus TaxID=1808955 RepID=A0A6M0Q4F4_9BACI|nr:UDP-N-acetylmuramoyl-L-alanine--D-glutamate ligase [Bacillus mesophilus]MBM7659457.1 UDP-N-acetylmuramoylalanine--D-glutamate ligase [Bacillus mesophilus]NEY70330.1 UDP-N-acetylmuramoyl-L-alanine--D-glutamate ligase [Bacillus mesophilus]